MSINLTDEIEAKTKKGKLGAAKQIFLEGDMQNVEKEIQDINSRHSALSTKHESLSRTVQGISANGTASMAINVTYNNRSSKLNSENVQDAITEVVTSLKARFLYKGIAQPTTNPGVPDSNVFYIAGEGSYPNFGNQIVEIGQIAVLKWDGSWHKEVLEIGAGSGNMILDWNTDVATTRKQVLSKYRKSGVQISYKDPSKGWINEQYIGTSKSDTEWAKDYNWQNIITNKNIPRYVKWNTDAKTTRNSIPVGERCTGLTIFYYDNMKRFIVETTKLGNQYVNNDEHWGNDEYWDKGNSSNSGMIIVEWKGNTIDTKKAIPLAMRFEGAIIIYIDDDYNIHAERYILKGSGVRDTYWASDNKEWWEKLKMYGSDGNYYAGLIDDINDNSIAFKRDFNIESTEQDKIASTSGITTYKGLAYLKLTAPISFDILHKWKNTYTEGQYFIKGTDGTFRKMAESVSQKLGNVTYKIIKTTTLKEGEEFYLNFYTNEKPFIWKLESNLFKAYIYNLITEISSYDIQFEGSAPNLLNPSEAQLNCAWHSGSGELQPINGYAASKVPVKFGKKYYIVGSATLSWAQHVLLDVNGKVLRATSGEKVNEVYINDINCTHLGVTTILPAAGNIGVFETINKFTPYAGGAVSNELTHIHVGDSISAGTDIEVLFKQVFGGDNYNFVKKAVSGANINSAFSFIKGVPLKTLRKAQLITFQIGTNNYMTDSDITELPEKSFMDIPYDGVDTIDKHLATFQNTIYQTYAKCIEYIMYYNPTARISFITIPQYATSSSSDEQRRKTNDIIKHICGIYNLEVIDAGNNSGVSLRNWKIYSTDGTHYSNPNGEYMWWGYIARRCKEIIQNIVLRPSIVE